MSVAVFQFLCGKLVNIYLLEREQQIVLEYSIARILIRGVEATLSTNTKYEKQLRYLVFS
jgi:hypothetical protein